ncbi:solute carrier family 13 member 2-like [Centruroides sculpturatus]|uniref:solute carrier family 13 member 2-like n=1 Tax=Centruroides sculpturatus TaxID=218467 RepID=UPI000C6ECD81|nr:solute carrier family 13 member 2-like [Centruroides sculpturatus]
MSKESTKKVVHTILRSWKLLLGVLIPILLLPLPLIIQKDEAKCGYVVLLMASYFTFEPIPLAATAFIPVFLFPILGILGTEEVCYTYMKATIMMYLGSLLLAAAVEHSQLHRRIAWRVLMLIGTGPRWLMLGFLITTTFLSMWITNTAATAMLVPIVEAVVSELETELKYQEKIRSSMERVSIITIQSINLQGTKFSLTESTTQRPSIINNPKKLEKTTSNLRKALFLSVAYAANCGGTGTLIGSGPNLVFKGVLEDSFPNYTSLTFGTWMLYNVPVMLIWIILCWILLQIYYIPFRKTDQNSGESKEVIRNVIIRNYEKLGSMSFHEFAVMALFLLLVFLWIMRDPPYLLGWARLINSGVKIKDATPSIAVAMLLFLIPAKPTQLSTSPPLLDWKTAQAKVPWGVLILLGGGLALAEGAKESGLSVWLGNQLVYLKYLSIDGAIIVLCIFTAALTEVISNMSMATIMLPVANQMAAVLKVHPILIMLPVTISCSLAFMLPVGNPSNAIVYENTGMTTPEMAKPGFIFKILCCGVELLMINTFGVHVFHLHSHWNWENSTVSSMATTYVPPLNLSTVI